MLWLKPQIRHISKLLAYIPIPSSLPTCYTCYLNKHKGCYEGLASVGCCSGLAVLHWWSLLFHLLQCKSSDIQLLPLFFSPSLFLCLSLSLSFLSLSLPWSVTIPLFFSPSTYFLPLNDSFLCALQASEENGEQVPFYSVAISLPEGEDSKNSRWTVTRKLPEFQALHRKLTEVTPPERPWPRSLPVSEIQSEPLFKWCDTVYTSLGRVGKCKTPVHYG